VISRRCAAGSPIAAGNYLLRPDGGELEYIWIALAEYFAVEIEKGATPKAARDRAHEKCLKFRHKAKPIDIRGKLVPVDEALDRWIVESLAADVSKKLYNADDKTLRTHIEKCFGVEKSPRNNAEWKQVLAALSIEASQWGLPPLGA
jgi:hypothetical protein